MEEGADVERIIVEKANEKKLHELQVSGWSPWECAPSVFDWEYSDRETCYVTHGKAKVTAEGQEVEFGAGDIVTFPKGLRCTWQGWALWG